MTRKGKSSRKTGRPPLYQDQELLNTIIQRIENSQSINLVTRSCGISHSTFYNWKERGQKAREKKVAGKRLAPGEAILIGFLDRVDAASAVGQMKAIDEAHDVALRKGDPNALIKLIDMKYGAAPTRSEIDARISGTVETKRSPEDQKLLKEIGDYLARRNSGTSPGP